MNRVLRNPIVAAIALLVFAIVLFSTLVIVPETRQGVILRFQQPVDTVNPYRADQPFGQTGAGLIAKVPFIDRIVWIDKRVLDIELNNQPVLSTDQLRLEVDAFARFRIVNPLQAVISTGSAGNTEERVAAQLEPLLSSALRAELGRRPFAALLSPERGAVMDNIQNALQRTARQYGAEIVDVRIKHADLPDGSPLESALARMRSAREQEAVTIRAQGDRDAQVVRADAEARAAQIYAQSFGKDAEFYAFWRAMQSYRTTLVPQRGQSGNTSIILSPQDGYLREFGGRER
ncbi:protease modulator HflC [Sphingomonas sp. Leaf407]|uniref:protease modulator HflC n=1 Tax=unclassified Sphingomonas TaxID=196159 RepID=UPI0006F3F55E|nr:MULTISPECIES: protease modulator HflC [unclassified Sphingomonas]KQN35555.1 protease modulator HflC [Sphingomonas sp. Leaf42]KQT26422.1 protease modulator HflC [Sphingomonas sp. Leaf407]